MVARCIKVEIYRNLRKLSEKEKAISDVSYKRHVANLMNLIAQESSFFTWFYTKQTGQCPQNILENMADTTAFASCVEVARSIPPLKHLIVTKFGRQALSDSEYDAEISLHKLINFGEMYRLLQNMKCFHVSSAATKDYYDFSGELMLWVTNTRVPLLIESGI